jgi:hypothetical protein
MFRNSNSLKASSLMSLKSASFNSFFYFALLAGEIAILLFILASLFSLGIIKAVSSLSDICLFCEAKRTKRFRIE